MSVHRYEAVSTTRADTGALGALERALERTRAWGGGEIIEFTVGESDNNLVVTIAFDARSEGLAASMGGHLLAAAWYDAFGERRAPPGRILDDRASP